MSRANRGFVRLTPCRSALRRCQVLLLLLLLLLRCCCAGASVVQVLLRCCQCCSAAQVPVAFRCCCAGASVVRCCAGAAGARRCQCCSNARCAAGARRCQCCSNARCAQVPVLFERFERPAAGANDRETRAFSCGHTVGQGPQTAPIRGRRANQCCSPLA